MAHELRTPLSGVRGEAELALRGELPRDVRGALEQILRGTERMQSVHRYIAEGCPWECAHSPRHRFGTGGRYACDSKPCSRPVHEGACDLHLLPLSMSCTWVSSRTSSRRLCSRSWRTPLRHARENVSLSVSRERGEIRFAVQDDGAGAGEVDITRSSSPVRAQLGARVLACARTPSCPLLWWRCDS